MYTTAPNAFRYNHLTNFGMSYLILVSMYKYVNMLNFLLKQRRRLITHANAKSKSEKFPPPHQDGAVGYPLGASHHIDPALVPPDVPFSTTSFSYPKEPIQTWSGPLVDPASAGGPRRKKHTGNDGRETSRSYTGSHREKHRGKKSAA